MNIRERIELELKIARAMKLEVIKKIGESGVNDFLYEKQKEYEEKILFLENLLTYND